MAEAVHDVVHAVREGNFGEVERIIVENFFDGFLAGHHAGLEVLGRGDDVVECLVPEPLDEIVHIEVLLEFLGTHGSTSDEIEVLLQNLIEVFQLALLPLSAHSLTDALD